jgi:hypothetical protein
MLPGKVFTDRTGCCWQDRLLFAGQVVAGRTGWLFLAEKVVVDRTGCCLQEDFHWQDRLFLAGRVVADRTGCR